MAKSMKNPNGYGSCYKAKGRREKPWIARKTVAWEVTDDGKAKQIKRTIGYFKTKAEGLKALASYSYNKYEEMTIQQLYNEWSEQHFKKIKTATMKQIESKYNQHVSKLNDYKIRELKSKEYQDFYNNISNSTGTAKGVMSVLNMMLDYAVKFEYLDKNFARFVDYKKSQKVLERTIFTKEEIKTLSNNTSLKFVDGILIMLYTGLRVSELLNLKWEDIKLDEQYLIVTESKTESGRNRLVPLIDKVVELLQNRISDNEYVFHNKKGAIPYTTFRNNFIKLMDKLEMDHTIHDCRHTFASMMSNVNANHTAISKIVGHSSYSITEKIYTHKDKEELLKEVNRLQQ